MHDVAHVFPAVDHLAHQPPRPTAADAERIAALLSVDASADLRDASSSGARFRRQFLDAAAELETMRKRHEESDFQAELGRDIARLRASRSALLQAADDLRECLVRELDA